MTLRPFRAFLGKKALRRSSRKSQLHRDQSRKMLTQQLEDRRLLAGPELIAIRPDAGALLQSGDTLNIAPREFNLLFKGGADLNESTINANTVRLVRSGGDGTFGDGNEQRIALGYVGLDEPGSTDPEELQRIVFRTASSASHNPTDDLSDPAAVLNSFPDDTYRIEIIGAGATVLENNAGEAFNSGVNYALPFRLDRGAQVVAVVPQPIERTGTGNTSVLAQHSDKIVVYFDNQLLDQNDAEDPRFYRLIDTATTIGGGDDITLIPKSAVYDSAKNSVTLTFDSDIPEGTYRLDVGYSADGSAANNGAVQVGSLFTSSSSVSSDYVVNGYLGDKNGSNADVSDVDTYAIRVENPAGATVNIVVDPEPATLAIKVSLLNSSGGLVASATGVAGATVALAPNVALPGKYTVKIETVGGYGSYVLNTSLAGAGLAINDDNSYADVATSLGVLGSAGITLTSAISPQGTLGVKLPPYPGGTDEPGHREIQREAHIGATGTNPTAPAAIESRNYYFPATIGFDPNGIPYPNKITEEEKRIVRGIFEVLSSLSGFEFVETTKSGGGNGTSIGKGDLRALDPNIGPDDDVAGLGGSGAVVLNDSSFNQANRFYGDGFTQTMMHEILHSLGLSHAYELPAIMSDIALPNDVLPGDNDVVHLQRIVPPNSTDIDLFKFVLEERGKWTGETVAERLASPSKLDSVLTLYRQNDADPNKLDLVARNDRYFGNDAFLELDLEPGTYFVGVSSTGNDDYDPKVPNSGYGGTTDGGYELKLSFAADRGDAGLRDADGTPLDGDGNGEPGGVNSFWFQASDKASTIYVDRVNDTNLNAADGDGSLADPFDTISSALNKAQNRIVVPQNAGATIAAGEKFTINDGVNASVVFTFGAAAGQIAFAGLSPSQIATNIAAAVNAKVGTGLKASVTASVSGTRVVDFTNIDSLDVAGTSALLKAPNLIRVVGNAGADGDIDTVADNVPYLVGSSGGTLRDGLDLLVPQGVTMMIDAGALIKMSQANIDIGSSSINISRAGSAIQVLGTPEAPVLLRSYHNDAFGGDSDGIGSPRPGDFGGIVIRDDSDLESDGIFLNYVNHADINNGGGKVFVDTIQQTFTPIHIIDARPTLSFNHISNSQNSAISASPDSFDDSLGRIGPDVHGNFLSDNKIDGLFVRINIQNGSPIERLTVPGRFDDSDIAHVLTQSLIISGNPGGFETDASGALTARAAGRLMVDPGVVVKLNNARIEAERGGSALIAEGTENRPVIFTSLFDDRYGGSGTFNTDSGVAFSTGSRGDWAGLFFGEVSFGSIDHALISFAGGDSPIEGASANFNAIEIHQADVRITNSLIKDNADGNATDTRSGRGANQAATIYVRGSQPVIVSNSIVDNAGTAISINANSLRFENLVDPGRTTGSNDRFSQFDDNSGPLVRLNQLDNNSTNGMLVRGELLTTESVWDDTDIVHVLRSMITVQNHHTFSGLTLQSSNTESLVVKLSNTDTTTLAGFTATGEGLEIIDRIGGTIHVLGTPGHPVVLASLSDDSIGAGFAPDGTVMKNTNNSVGTTTGASGDWRGFLFDEWSNDRNVAIIRERENPLTAGRDVNGNRDAAQFLGIMAPDEKSADENRRMGFEVNGFISPDDPNDVDMYSFQGTAGTGVWIDIDRTDTALDAIIEVVNANGTVLARSNNSGVPTGPGSFNGSTLTQNPLLGGDFYSQNFRDPGLFFTLPGSANQVGTFFVRVRSAPKGPDFVTIDGQSSGKYQLQIRQRQEDEFPGSTIQFADIRDAVTAIDVRGLPAHSLLIGEAGELAANNDTRGTAQTLVNLLETDMAAIGVEGALSDDTDVDWYRFDLTQTGVQTIAGVNDADGTVAIVLDLDYGDKANGADTTVAVYDSAGRLIYISRESNIQDDQKLGVGLGIDDLSRGSVADKDPYIGPIHITPGRAYYVAVMSNRQLPTSLMGVFQSTMTNDQNRLTRLEPVNSVKRVVEDHIGFSGYNSQGARIEPVMANGIFDITSKVTLDNHVKPFELADVVTYIATDSTTESGDDIYTASIFQTQRYQTKLVDDAGNANNDIQDIVIRSDGAMYGYRRLTAGSDSVGQLVKIDPNDGSFISTQNDDIPGTGATPNVGTFSSPIVDKVEQFTTSHDVDAFTFQRTGTTGSASAPVPTYDIYYAVRESDTSTKLYRARENGSATASNPSTGTKYGYLGDIQPAGVVNAKSSLTVSDNTAAPDTNFATIRFESKSPGLAGNGITINITNSRAGTVGVSVTGVSGTTINLEINRSPGSGTITAAPTVGAIVNAINNHAQASQLVTAVITSGATGMAAFGGTNSVTLSGGNDGTNGGPILGRVTGLSYDNFDSNGNLFGVTSAGELLEIDDSNGRVLSRQIIRDPAGTPYKFQGLALGPQNLNGGIYKEVLFAVTESGQIVAFTSDGTVVYAFDSGAASSRVTGMTGNATGIAFSPLDFNLWHVTTKRGGDQGHGINTAPDGSRIPGIESVTINDPGPGADRSSSQANGGASFYFGFEQWQQSTSSGSSSYLTYPGANAQLGILNTDQHSDLSSNLDIRNSYNFPGGAVGTLKSNSFSLSSASELDRPTLYFNYFLETENHAGSLSSTDANDPFRDSARLFASRDGGLTWELLTTNSSRLSSANPNNAKGELPGFLSHLSDAGLNAGTPRDKDEQLVQELFDNTGVWRQARVDLSTFAGVANIQLRFDFSTAGAMNDSTLFIGSDTTASGRRLENEFGEFSNDNRSIRSSNNLFEGFYIDDIIVGYAERGEMVTGATTDSSITDLNSGRTDDPNGTARPDILKGPYQFEIRRTGEYASMSNVGISIGTTFNTNDRHIVEPTSIVSQDFDSETLGDPLWMPPVGGVDLFGFNIPANFISPWIVSAVSSQSGSQSLQSGATSSLKPVSIYQATLADLGSSSTDAGVIQFAVNVDSLENVNGLRFFIDGVPQNLLGTGSDENQQVVNPTFLTGDQQYRIVRFPFSSGLHTFTWVLDASASPTAVPNVAFIDDVQLLQGGTGLLADQNRERVQGMFIIDSNIIRDSRTLGINVQPGTQESGGSLPHPGSTINFPIIDPDKLVPGVVIVNNVIDGRSAIRFAGENNASPNRPVPFGRIINNTLIGNKEGGGVGIAVVDRASPTLMNNIITDFGTGIVDSTPSGVSFVTRTNYFQGNNANGPTGLDPVIQPAGTPLFVDVANQNYYLVGSSAALDRSLNQLEDRLTYTSFKRELGIADSNIDAPRRDVFGQLRINSSQIPGGGGSTQFIDIGAVDRSDFDKPFAELTNPIDYTNTLREDADPNATVVHLKQPIVNNFSILLNDGQGINAPFEGTGINPATVNASTVTVRRNNVTLVEGVDFTLGYNEYTGELRLTPFSTLWEPAGVYEIILDNSVIADNAGNLLLNNQADGTTKFTIILPEVPLDFGDAKLAGSANVYGTLLANNAARHAIINNASPRLGSYVDSENDSALLTGGLDDTPATVVATSPSASAIFDIQPHATATGGTIIRIDSLANPPVAGDVVSIDVGRVAKQFELVPAGIAPGVGNIPVRFAATDTADLIAAKLIAKINAEMNAAGDSLVVQAVAGSPDTIEIFNRDDEDGVNVGVYNDGTTDFIVFLKPGVTGTTTNKDDILGFLNPQDPAGAQIPVSVTGTGYVSAWIDFDGNGVFHPTLEKVIDNVLVTDATNPTIFNVKTPAGTTGKRTWARFRISPEGGLQPTGLAVGGEVEDYEVQILNAPLPVPVDDPTSPSTHYTISEDGTLDTNDAPDVIPSVLDNDVISPLVITPVTVLLGQNVSNGTLVLDSATGDFTYTPLPDFVGIDTFTYRLATQQSAIDSILSSTLFATVTIEVQPVNDAPQAADQTIVMLEDTPRTVLESELLANATADASPSYPVVTPTAPWDESDQVLHVVSLHVGGTTIDSTTPIGDFPIATSRGQILSATFDTSDPANIFLVSFEYQANQDLNRDNLRLVGDPPILDEITYTISDDGKSDDPNVLTDGGADDEIGVFDAVNGRLTHTAKISFDVRPQNDDPIANDDAIDKSSTRWLSYWAGLGQPVPVPTEDQSLTIPIDFLLSNDVNARATAADENVNLNDGSLTIPDPGTVLTTALGGTVTFNNDGTFTYRAPDHYYGEDTFTYTAQDVGINEDINGLRSLTPLTDTAVVTIFVEPINDMPVAFPRELRVDEIVEYDAFGNLVNTDRKILFDKEFLLQQFGVDPVLPGNSDPALIDPYNESNQALRVVAFTDADESIDGETDLAGSGGTGTLTMMTPSGGVLSFNFTAGAFVDGYYEPAVDYNGLAPHETDPLNPLEFFNYIVSDDGTVLLPPVPPGTAYTPDPFVEARSLPTRVSLTVADKNDAPEFPAFATVTFPEDIQADGTAVYYDIYAGSRIVNYDPLAGRPEVIFPGHSTALDERLTETLSFNFVTTHEPAGMFSATPVLDQYGVLTLTPNPDVFGYAVFEITATDNGQSFNATTGLFEDDFRSTTRTLTVHITPVNDQPVTEDRTLTIAEVVDNDPLTGLPNGNQAILPILPADLLRQATVNDPAITTQNPSRESDFADGSQSIYDEHEQDLRVVVFGIPNASGGITLVTAADSGTVFTTINGGTLKFNFDGSGAFSGGEYRPAIDYNRLSPFAPTDAFTYIVEDFGATAIPGADQVTPVASSPIDYTSDPDPFGNVNNRSVAKTVHITVTEVNDPPFIPDFDTSTTTVDGTNVSYNANSITFNEREQSDAPSLTFDLYAAAGVEIKPGPLTALDELVSQSLVSIVVQPALDLGGNSLVPAGLMSSDPLLTATGDITISPVADAFGVAVYDIIVTDSGSNVAPNNAVSIRKLTISINPVNDQPVAQDQEFSVDEAIEDAGESTSDAAFKIHFDAASLMAGSLPGQFDLALGTPYNEDDQTFDVVRFIVPSPNPGDADVIVNDVSDPVGTAIVPVTTRNGGLLQFSFVNGIFTEGTYTPAVDYNEQAEFDVSPNFINEVFQFIIRDNDGAGTSVPGSTTIVDLPSKFSEPATVTLKVNQRNDNPFVPAFDNLPIHVAEIEPTDAPTITLDLFNNPASVILPGRVTALDELAQQGLTITLVPVSVPGNIVPGADSLMAATPVLQADGTLTITPTPEAFGVAVYDVVVTDTGGTSPANQQTIRRLTITIDPVNDAPVAADQVFAPVDESIERDEFGNLVSPFPTTVVTFDKDRLLQNAVEGQFASSLNPLFNESEQELDVVRFEMVGAGGASIVIDGATLTQAEQTITRVSSGGGTFAFTFKDQVFVSGSFTPSVDYNQRTPFSPTEQFKFVIQDRGNVTVPGADPARSEDLGTLRSAAVTATFQVLDKNDPPIFTMAGEVNHSAQVNVTEDQNGLGTPVVVSGFVSDVFAGPVTALDENSAVHGQSVIFESLVLVGTDHGIFSQPPTLSATTGDLTLFPNPHAYGTQVYLVTANDQAPEGAARLTKTITINVAPVNDTPVTYPRSFTEIEAVELDKFGDPLDPAVEIDFDAAGLINGDSTLSEIPATAGDFASSVPAPFNEIEQTLRVVQFLIEDPVTGGTITIDGSLFKGQTVTQLTVTGGELEFSFDANGFFTTGKYRPAVDYNRLTPFDPTDVLQYVVEDDGRTTVPGGPASPIFLTPERSLPSSMTFRLIENNDPPVFVMPSQITILEDQASDHAPISQDNFITGIAPGPGTALDEVGQSVTFSLQLLSTDVGLFSATPTISPTGRLTLLPNPDAFGTQVYLVTASDNAPGGTAKISVQTLSVNVTPVNDVPRAADQTLDLVTEAVERDSDGNLLSPLPVASMTFDKTQLLRNAVEGVFDAAINPSFNESEQELRVVAFRVPGAPMLVDGSIDEPGLTGGNGTVTRTTLTNATLTFTFVNGEFVSGTYTPSVDYNRRSPFAANDQFEFMIEDRGAVTIPGSNPLVTQDTGSLRSAYANATITTIEQNDPPEFDFLPVVNVLERDDNGETVVPDWAKNIQAGPSTALDELQRESVQFTFVPGLSSVPQGLFRLPPKVANNGALSVFPAPDAVGTATIVIEATDLDPSTPGFVPASHFVTFTLNVQPVNDAPRLNLAVVNTAGVSNSDPDLAYSVSTDGTITYTLREDNTQPGGNASTAYFIPLVQGAVNPPNGFAALGLLDVFNVGPDNEASGAPGGSQVLQLASFPRSTQRGGTLTEVFQGGQRVGLNYVPPTNYNSAIGADDGFTYSVNDNSIVNGDPTAGETYSLSQGTLFEDPRAVVNRVRLRMSPVNDRPEFETASLSVESAEDAGVTLKNAFAFNISAGPRSTATDESAQTLAFDVQPVGFDANAFFTTVPTISPTGRLTYQSAPDVFGEFKFTVMLSDNGPTDTATRGDLFQSVPVTMTINVRPVNDAPVKVSNAPNLTYVVGEDGSVVIPFVGNAADQPGLLDFFRVGPDNETSTLVGGGQTIDVASPYPATSDGGGTITPVLNAANEVIGLRYTPTLNFAGTDKFTYTISDDGVTVALGAGGVATNDFKSVTNQVTIGVSGVNDPPQFNGADDVDSVEDQGPVVVPNWATGVQAGPDEATDELLGDGTNPAQTVSFVLNQISGSASLFAVPPTVTITGNTASLSYTTAADANGDATFEVTLRDNGDPTDASVGHNNESVTQTFTIRVAAVNDVPTFTAGAVVDVDEDSDPYSQVWATNISPGPADESGQSVRFEVTVPTASLGLFETLPTIDAGGVLQFKPAKDASGFADLQVRAIDSLDAVSAVANLRINIDEVNDKPIAVTDNLDADEDAVVVIDSIDLTINDVDPDLASNPLESLTVVLPASSTTQRGARLTYNPVNGQITYDPTLAVELQRLKPGDVLIDTFLYSVKDASGIESDPVEVTVTVQGINDAPVLNPDTVIINANGPTRFRPQDNDTDVDGTIVATSIVITSQPKSGALSVEEDGTLVYTPFASFDGQDEFRYTVADNLGQQSKQATVIITTSRLPIVPDFDDVVATSKDTTIVNVGAAATPVEGQLDLTSLNIISGPANGTATANPDGTISYKANVGHLGPDSLQVTITDSAGRVSEPATIHFNVVAFRLQNPNPTRFNDVNASGTVTTLDALLIINRIGLAPNNTSSIPVTAADRGPAYYDVNGDDIISALDALQVINQLSLQGPQASSEGSDRQGSGEAIPQLSPLAQSAVSQSTTLHVSEPVHEIETPTKVVDSSMPSTEPKDFLDLIAESHETSEGEESEDRLGAVDEAFANLL